MKRDGKKKSEGECKNGSMELLSRKVQKEKQRLQLFLRTTDDSFGRWMTRAVGSKLVEGLEERYLGDVAVKE